MATMAFLMLLLVLAVMMMAYHSVGHCNVRVSVSNRCHGLLRQNINKVLYSIGSDEYGICYGIL